jgi:hypothetical protein
MQAWVPGIELEAVAYYQQSPSYPDQFRSLKSLFYVWAL